MLRNMKVFCSNGIGQSARIKGKPHVVRRERSATERGHGAARDHCDIVSGENKQANNWRLFSAFCCPRWDMAALTSKSLYSPRSFQQTDNIACSRCPLYMKNSSWSSSYIRVYCLLAERARVSGIYTIGYSRPHIASKVAGPPTAVSQLAGVDHQRQLARSFNSTAINRRNKNKREINSKLPHHCPVYVRSCLKLMMQQANAICI